MANRNQAQMLNNVKQVLTIFKQNTQTPMPVAFKTSELLRQHKLSSAMVHALIYHGWINKTPDGSSFKYQWIAGTKEITDAAVQSLYDKYKNIENQRKSEWKAKVAKGGKVRQLPQPSTSQTKTEVKEQVKPNEPAKITVPKQPKLNGSVKKAKPEKPKEPAKVIKGTIFGYKQLKFIKELYRKQNTTVMIDDKFILENVLLIEFHVEGSKLTLFFYMYATRERTDESSLLAKIQLDNVVLAFSERFVSENQSALAIYTVPVTDPYNLECLKS